jgi:hypothetical protein
MANAEHSGATSVASGGRRPRTDAPCYALLRDLIIRVAKNIIIAKNWMPTIDQNTVARLGPEDRKIDSLSPSAAIKNTGERKNRLTKLIMMAATPYLFSLQAEKQTKRPEMKTPANGAKIATTDNIKADNPTPCTLPLPSKSCITRAITGDKTGVKRRFRHPVHGLVMRNYHSLNNRITLIAFDSTKRN